jgi:integrase
VEQLRIRRLLAAPISGYNLPALTAPILANWRDERLQQVRSSTVNRELSLISAVLNVARKEWALPIDNPLPLIRRPRDPAPRSRRLSAAEEQFLLDALTPRGRSASGRFQGVQNPWLKPIVLLALETAMRRSELLALRWENVDARRRVALLPLAKNGDARAVPLSQAALDVLTALGYRDSGPVFPTSTEAVKRGFGRAVARARQAYVDACAEDGAYPHPAFLVDLHFHDLRHEATSRLAEKLHNVLELSAVTGHRDLRVLKRYYHPDPSRLALKLD